MQFDLIHILKRKFNSHQSLQHQKYSKGVSDKESSELNVSVKNRIFYVEKEKPTKPEV